MLLSEIVMLAAIQNGTAVAEGPSELFPDPTLADVAEWDFSDGAPAFGPLGGTGPGISADADFADSTGRLTGADNTAFAAATSNGATYAVALTIANFVSGSISCAIRDGSATDLGTLSNGVITKNIVAGSTPAVSFILTLTGEDNDFDITAISVTAA